MANEVKTKNITKATFTITLASLADNAGRSSLAINNATTKYPAALIYLSLVASGTPTADKTYDIYLLRGNDPASSDWRTDAWAGTDAAFTPVNAALLGQIITTATASGTFRKAFDTSPLGPLGPEWGIGVYCNGVGGGGALAAGGHYAGYVNYVPEIQ